MADSEWKCAACGKNATVGLSFLYCRPCLEQRAENELLEWFARHSMPEAFDPRLLGGYCMGIALHTIAAGCESREAFLQAAAVAWDDTAPFAAQCREVIRMAKGEKTHGN